MLMHEKPCLIPILVIICYLIWAANNKNLKGCFWKQKNNNNKKKKQQQKQQQKTTTKKKKKKKKKKKTKTGDSV